MVKPIWRHLETDEKSYANLNLQSADEVVETSYLIGS